MRFCINYETKKKPIGYQMLFVSHIKKSLSTYDEDYFKCIYEFENKK